MIEQGISPKDFMSMPPRERGGAFVEALYECAGALMGDPTTRARLTQLAQSTFEYFVGDLTLDQRTAVGGLIKTTLDVLSTDPSQDVGRVASEHPWLTALYFNPELKKELERKRNKSY